MSKEEYSELVKKYTPQYNKVRSILLAFVVGGFIGLIGEGIIELLCLNFSLSRNDASTFMIVIYIFVGSLCTALGFFDKLVTICRCGLLIPITGFAHSMTSSTLDYKREGPIYGVVSAWFFGMIRYLLGGTI